MVFKSYLTESKTNSSIGRAKLPYILHSVYKKEVKAYEYNRRNIKK